MTVHKNYDPEIHEEYLIHDTPFAATSFIAMCRLYRIALTQLIRLKGTNFLL